MERNKQNRQTLWVWICMAALIAAPIGGLSTGARGAEGGPDPIPNVEAQKTVRISLPEDFYFKSATTTATVTANGNPNETFEVTLTGPGSITPDHLTLTSGQPQTVDVTLPNVLQWATYKAVIDGTNPEISASQQVGTVEVAMTSNYNTVAAGAVGSNVHQSTYTIKITAPDGQGVPDFTFPKPEIIWGGEGPDDDITADPGFGPEDGDPVTDGDGVVTSTFTSGHRTTPTTVGGPDGHSVTINQIWNSLEGNENAWSYPPDFFYDVADPITYHMRLNRGNGDEPIEGHSFSMVTTLISGLEWNPLGGVDEDGDGVVDGAYDPAEYSVFDTDTTNFDQWSWLSEFGGVSESGGDYTAEQTIHFNPMFMADYVEFDAVDGDAFDAQGAY